MRRIFVILLLNVCLLPNLLYAASSWKDEYILFSEKHNYRKAIGILSEAEKSEPGNMEIKLAKARVYDWSGEYEQADEILKEYLKKHPEDADAQFQLGTLRFHQGKLQEAEEIFTQILEKHPEYEDAGTTLELIRKNPSKEYHWQLDTGYELSRFSRQKQPGWNQEFLQLTHFLNDNTTAIHGTLRRYDQFSTNIDSEIEIGVDHRFSPRIYGYLTGDISPDSTFRPKWFTTGGGGLRLDNPEDHWPIAAWFTLDSRYDHYSSTRVYNINPGLRVEPAENWAIAWKSISVHQRDAKTAYGWSAQLDGQIMPGWLFYLGFANAPETVAAITVDTETYFTGLTVDLTSQHVLRLGYAHDDRENSYIREVYNASVSYHF